MDTSNPTPTPGVTQGIFDDLTEFKRWVSYTLRYDPKREKFDKVPHNGHRGLSTSNINDWMTINDAAETAEANGLSGIGFVLTGGVERAGWQLVGMDFDDVNFEKFKLPIKTYMERSPSKKGIRAFVWVPAPWAKRFKDTVIKCAHCRHGEIYFGSAARFLTITFDAINEEQIAELTKNDLLALEKWKLNSATTNTVLDKEIQGIGKVVDFSTVSLNQDQKQLIRGSTDIDRSAVLHGLLIKLIDERYSRDDIIATVTNTPALWNYCLEHREDNPVKALKFAQDEFRNAYSKSMVGMRNSLIGFSANWADTGDICIPRDLTKQNIFRDIGDFKPKPLVWLINNYIEAGTLSYIFGPPGCCKTFVALDIACCVGSDRPWHGQPVLRPGTVLYLAGEGQNNLARRVDAWSRHNGVAKEDLRLKVCTIPVSLIDSGCVDLLREAIEALPEPPVLIVVDTLARNFGAGDENSTKDMNAFIKAVDELRGEATVLIVHHSGHSNQDRERGSSALRGAADAIYQVERQGGRIVKLTAQKMKDAPTPPPMALEVKGVALGFAEDNGELATSLVLVDGAAQRAIRADTFYEQYPQLATRKSREYLPKMLELIYDGSTVSQRELKDKLAVSLATINKTIKALREYELLEVDSYRLTAKGVQGAADLLPQRPDILFKTHRPRGGVRWPPNSGCSVTTEQQPSTEGGSDV